MMRRARTMNAVRWASSACLLAVAACSSVGKSSGQETWFTGLRESRATQAGQVAAGGEAPALAPLNGRARVATQVLAAALPQPSASASSPALGPNESTRDAQLYAQHVQPLLRSASWNEALGYATAYFTMVPIATAFVRGNAKAQSDWIQYIKNLHQSILDPNTPTNSALAKGELNRWQYLYAMTTIACVATHTGSGNALPKDFLSWVEQDLHEVFTQRPAIHWDHPTFQGFFNNIEYKLNLGPPARSYYRAILDTDLLMLGSAANVAYLARQGILEPKQNASIQRALDLARRIFTQEVSSQEGHPWLFQPGAWRDHPDYAYSGHPTLMPNLSPALYQGGAWDTSHATRLAPILWSLQLAARDEAELAFYQDQRTRFNAEFQRHVLIPPSNNDPYWRTTNFIDGWNGLYRYRRLPAVYGVDAGYGPYQLSGTLMMGWWAFLPGGAGRDLYLRMAEGHPLPEAAIRTYLAMGVDSSIYRNGQREYITRCASQLELPF